MKTASYVLLSLALSSVSACLTRHANDAAATHADGAVTADASAEPVAQPGADAGGAVTTNTTGDAAAAVDTAPACTPGTSTCSDDHTARICGATGWEQEACSGATPHCWEGACVACSPGAVKCQDSGTLAICDQSRRWNQQACPAATPICDGDACVVCLPGTVLCGEAQTIKICNQNRSWQQQFMCSGATPACYQGGCVQCQPGETRGCGNCNEGVQTCDATGKWGLCVGEPGPVRVWYRDVDGDGYGSSNFPQSSCAANVPGFALKGTDCCDVDVRVHPGAGFQTTGDGKCGVGWDFDCSGTVEQQYPAIYKEKICDYYECTLDRVGWLNTPVPACGNAATLVSSCEKQPSSCTWMCTCSLNQTQTVQGCR